MKKNNIVKALQIAYANDLQRVQEDSRRMTESSTGIEDMKDLATGKLKKPRQIRDWEKNNGGG